MGFWWIGPAITIPLGFGIPAILASVLACGFVEGVSEQMAIENRARLEREEGGQERERRRVERGGAVSRFGQDALRQNHEIYWRAQHDEWRRYVDSHRRPV